MEQVEPEQTAGRSSTSTDVSERSSDASPARLFTHAGTLVKKEAPSRQDDRTPTEVSEVSSHASPPRILAHAGTLVKEEAPSRQDASTPDSRGRSRSPRGPLAPPGPRLTTPRPAPPRPVCASGGIGGALSWPGGLSRAEDRMRPLKTAAAGAGRGSTGFQQDLHQVSTGPSRGLQVQVLSGSTTGPSGGGIFNGSAHGSSPSEARPPSSPLPLGSRPPEEPRPSPASARVSPRVSTLS